MTASQANPQSFRFQGVTSATAEHALDTMIKNSPDWQQPIIRALKVREGDSGLSWITCLQDTLVTLFPKLTTSRSLAEIAESSYLELAESFMLYCSLPVLGRNFFQPLFTKIAGGKFTTGARAATILSTIGLTLVGGESIIHYSKNLMTAKIFKKDRFSDVINLSQGQMKSADHSQVVDKAKKRIMQCVAICAGIVMASWGLAKSKDTTKILGPIAKQIAKHLDFQESKVGRLCLSPAQLRLYMLLAVFPYLDSARDNLERVETASRLALILPYLAFGQDLLQNALLKTFKTFFKPILGKDGKPIPLQELANTVIAKHPQDTDAAVKAMAPLTLRKAALTGVPLAFGVGFTGFGVILLSQFWTKYRYQHQQPNKPQTPPLPDPAKQALTTSNQPPFPTPTVDSPESWNQILSGAPTGLPYQQPFSKPNSFSAAYTKPTALPYGTSYKYPLFSR